MLKPAAQYSMAIRFSPYALIVLSAQGLLAILVGFQMDAVRRFVKEH